MENPVEETLEWHSKKSRVKRSWETKEKRNGQSFSEKYWGETAVTHITLEIGKKKADKILGGGKSIRNSDVEIFSLFFFILRNNL